MDKSTISLVLSGLALGGALVSIYLQFFHKSNSIQANIGDLKLIQGHKKDPIQGDSLHFSLPITFINNGKRHIDIYNHSIYVTNELVHVDICFENSNNPNFSMSPGDHRPNIIVCNTTQNELIKGLGIKQMHREHKILVGLETILLTDKNRRIHTKNVVADVVVNEDGEFSINGRDYIPNNKILNLLKAKPTWIHIIIQRFKECFYL